MRDLRREMRSAKSLLIFDEPTTGLHFDDVAMLVKFFNDWSKPAIPSS